MQTSYITVYLFIYLFIITEQAASMQCWLAQGKKENRNIRNYNDYRFKVTLGDITIQPYSRIDAHLFSYYMK